VCAFGGFVGSAEGRALPVAITHNPTVRPKGVEPSADPLLAARAAPYALGLGRRVVEGARQ
jgi:catalase